MSKITDKDKQITVLKVVYGKIKVHKRAPKST